MNSGSWNNAMDNPINWSLRVGRLFRIDIRLHLLFLLWIVFRVIESLKESGQSMAGIGWGLTGASLLVASVLLHELGHCFGARRMGGSADEILLWPLGGLAMVQPPHHPRAHLITTIAGPAVNAALCLIAGGILVVWCGSLQALPLNPLHPLTPLAPGLVEGWPQFLLLAAFGLNLILLLFNLLPIYPLDGGQMVEAALWSRIGYRQAVSIATLAGMVGAIGLGLFGLIFSHILLIGIALFGYLTCYQRRQLLKEDHFHGEERPFGYDFSKGYGAFETRDAPPRQTQPGWFARRKAAQMARKAVKERETQRRHEEKFDRILQKISRQGMGALTAAEKKFLESETQRRKS